ncbi:MAG: hypothetical protein PHU53_04300, partial [Thermoplasmata archaeon]|nr:hypothetical protein [Thermoplasmata archaeon]
METKRIIAGMLVAIMIVSGFGIVSGSAATDNIPVEPAAIPPIQKNTVQRVVLAEDFTSWECPPCATFSPMFVAAVENLGYTKAAPAMYHVWWPNYDDDPIYQYNKQEVTDRVNYYHIPWVPLSLYDGDPYTTDTAGDYAYEVGPSPSSQAAIETLINTYSALPANVSIDTQGWISGGAGEIGVKVRAEENIAKTDLYVRVMLWENNITRPLWNYRLGVYDAPPYPNGETILNWGVWDYVPDATGTPIWTSGATAGDEVEITLPFDISDVDGIVESEVGVTVFVQSQSTWDVEQAAVETFANVPPAVTITSPASGTAGQILSGTIPITWTATDVEDADDTTLDISIDYSANGGVSWTNIMSGTNNNIAPFTYNWNTISAGIPDGPGYKIRVKAIDSKGDWRRPESTEPFSIDNTVNDKWYFQLDATGPNMDLDMKPVENTPNMKATASITNGGQWIVGTWDTTQTFSDKNINGAWTFNVNAKTPNPGNNPLVAYLYAKVFTSSNTATPLDTTILDNENIGAFQTTHQFTWTDTLSGVITNGDALLVEIWLSASGGPYPPISGVNTNYAFNTTATPWTYSNWVSSTTMVGTSSGAWVGTGGNPGGFVSITLTPPSTGATTLGIASGYYQQSFTTGMVPFEATLSFDWRCTGICTFNRAYTY